jgi:hypothetical protein
MRRSASHANDWIVTRLRKPAARTSLATTWTNCSCGAVSLGALASTFVSTFSLTGAS